MARTTRKITESVLFVFLVVFPFGQIFVIPNSFFSLRAPINALDILALLLAISYFLSTSRHPAPLRYFLTFAASGLFSLVFSASFFGFTGAMTGVLYLLRLLAYIGVFGAIVLAVKERKLKSDQIFNFLLASIVFSAVFGWVQYFFYPDTRGLYEWGWDDHLYRLVGTFLDPGFTGLIFSFGFLASFTKVLSTKSRWAGVTSLFLFVSVLFTYSRASYLALLAGVCYLLLKKGKAILIVPAILLVLFGMYLLPKPFGEGVKLERSASVLARLGNYSETLNLIEKSPVFGYGFNNLCLAKQKFLGDKLWESHSCSGSDSSLLLVLATTGILGLFLFTKAVYELVVSAERNLYGRVFIASLIALFIHGLFTNSFFYPWVLGYLAVLGGIVVKK